MESDALPNLNFESDESDEESDAEKNDNAELKSAGSGKHKIADRKTRKLREKELVDPDLKYDLDVSASMLRNGKPGTCIASRACLLSLCVSLDITYCLALPLDVILFVSCSSGQSSFTPGS